jgi:hypothetical protein
VRAALDAATPPPRRASAASPPPRLPAHPPRPAPPAVSSWVFAHAADPSDPALARPTATPRALNLRDATLEPDAAPPPDAAAPLEPLAPARAVEFAPDDAPGAARAASPGALIGFVVRGYAPGNFDASAAGAVCAALAAAGAAPGALVECDLGAPAPAGPGAAATAVAGRLRWRWAAPPSADAVAVVRARRDALVAALAADADAVLKRARLPGLHSFTLDCACRGATPVVDATGDGVAYAPVPDAAPALCGAALTRARREDPTALVGVDDGSASGGADVGKFCAWPTPPPGGVEGVPGVGACRRYGVSTGEADRAAARATALRVVRLAVTAAGAGLTTFPAVAVGDGAPGAEAAARAGVDGVAPRAAPSGLFASVPQLEARGDGAGFRAAVSMGLAPRANPAELFADAGDGCVGGAWRLEVAPPRGGDAPGGEAAVATLRVAGGRAVGVELIAAGAGYDAIPDVFLAPETVELMACARAPELAPGAFWLGVVGVDVLAPGAGFSAPPELALVNGGEAAPAELVPTFTVTALEYLGAGNFTAPPAVRVLAADAAEHPAAAAVMGLAAAEVAAPGAGYPHAWPQVSVAQGGGEGAVVAAVAVAGGVAELIVTAAGEGFSGLPLLEVTPPPGSTAGELCAAAGDLIGGVGFLHAGGVEVGGPCAPLALDSRSGEVCSRPAAPGGAAGVPGAGTCGARSYYFSGPPAPGAEPDDADASQCLLLAAEFETAVGAVVEPAAPAPSALEQADAPSEAAALRADAPRHATAAAPLPRARPFAAPTVGSCAYPTGAYRLHAVGRSACGDGECLIGATASSTLMRCMPSILTRLSLPLTAELVSFTAPAANGSACPPQPLVLRPAGQLAGSERAAFQLERTVPGRYAVRAARRGCARGADARAAPSAGAALRLAGEGPAADWELVSADPGDCALVALVRAAAASRFAPPCPPAHRRSPSRFAPPCRPPRRPPRSASTPRPRRRRPSGPRPRPPAPRAAAARARSRSRRASTTTATASTRSSSSASRPLGPRRRRRPRRAPRSRPRARRRRPPTSPPRPMRARARPRPRPPAAPTRRAATRSRPPRGAPHAAPRRRATAAPRRAAAPARRRRCASRAPPPAAAPRRRSSTSRRRRPGGTRSSRQVRGAAAAAPRAPRPTPAACACAPTAQPLTGRSSRPARPTARSSRSGSPARRPARRPFGAPRA